MRVHSGLRRRRPGAEFVTRHTDTAHEHVHMLINRIRFDGEVTSDSHDYRRQEIVMRAMEREPGLRQMESSKNAERRAATKGENEQGLHTGKPSTRQQLQQLCDAAARDCASFTDYAARLHLAGVDLVPVTQLEGTKLSGLSYRLDGVMKGSDLGKRYSPLKPSKIGVGYDKERDHEAVGRCLQRSALEGHTGIRWLQKKPDVNEPRQTSKNKKTAVS